MIVNVQYFDTIKDLRELTKLSDDELWKEGFNLDDFDFGFIVDSKVYEENRYDMILDDIPGFCCCDILEYKDKIFIMYHHS